MQFSDLWLSSDTFFVVHIITEYPEVEGTHKDPWAPPPAPHSSTQTHILCWNPASLWWGCSAVSHLRVCSQSQGLSCLRCRIQHKVSFSFTWFDTVQLSSLSTPLCEAAVPLKESNSSSNSALSTNIVYSGVLHPDHLRKPYRELTPKQGSPEEPQWQLATNLM